MNVADGLLPAVAAGPSHSVRWRKRLGASGTSPTVAGNRIYRGRIFFGDDAGYLYALRACDGKRISVVDGIVYFAALKPHTYGLDAHTGKQLWEVSGRRIRARRDTRKAALRRRLGEGVRVQSA